MDAAAIDEVVRILRDPGAVPLADGIPVQVTSVSLAPSGDELVVRYSVPPLPDGVARPPVPEGGTAASRAAEVAEELIGWATEHVRRYRPPPPLDRAQVARDLPDRNKLWRQLRSGFTDVRDIPGGFVGTGRFGTTLTIMLTAQAWQDYVVTCEIGCRNDYGVDADSAGDGPSVALDDLDESLATLDDDELFVVLDDHRLTGSTRAELPPVHGSAATREAERIQRGGPGAWFANGRDGSDSRFTDDSGTQH
jgi:hypothetical protein